MSTVNPPAMPAGHFVMPKPLTYGLLMLAVLGITLGGYVAVEHFHPAPAPDPVIPPAPAAPKAIVAGRFLRYTDAKFQATPDAGPAPIGMIRLDATKSHAPRIQWQASNPEIRFQTFSPDGSPARSIAEADVFHYGVHHFHATAVGDSTSGPVTDTSTVSVTLDPDPAPTPPVPKPVVPVPTPVPPVDPVNPPGPAPAPPVPPAPVDPNADPAFVTLGQTYKPLLGPAYAAAFEAGASALDAGQPFSAAVGVVARNWDSSRAALFVAQLTPKFAAIIPETTADAAVTPAQRAAMAKAWRGLAAGLRQ
jgi:hypothetical protein